VVRAILVVKVRFVEVNNGIAEANNRDVEANNGVAEANDRDVEANNGVVGANNRKLAFFRKKTLPSR
jgi:hypothetical protein